MRVAVRSEVLAAAATRVAAIADDLREDAGRLATAVAGAGAPPVRTPGEAVLVARWLLLEARALEAAGPGGMWMEGLELDALAAGVPADHPVRLHVVGYTTAMDEYMAAADILVGKPGGLTTSEALARGLVMVIVNPIPGQEERNADHLLEEGAAIRCNNLPVLAEIPELDVGGDDGPEARVAADGGEPTELGGKRHSRCSRWCCMNLRRLISLSVTTSTGLGSAIPREYFPRARACTSRTAICKRGGLENSRSFPR